MSTKCKNVTEDAVDLDYHQNVCGIDMTDAENIFSGKDDAENPVTTEKLSKPPRIEEYTEIVWLSGISSVEITRQRYKMISEVPEILSS